MTPLFGTFAAAVSFGLAMVLFEFGARRVYDYAITPIRFEVRLFGRFPVYSIGLDAIENAAMWRASAADIGSALTTLRLGNRIFGRAVVLELRRPFPRRVIVTPDCPAELLAEILTRAAVRVRTI